MEGTAERFVRVAYGSWGGGQEYRRYYERAVASLVKDTGRFYASRGGAEVRQMAQMIEEEGFYAEATVDEFTALAESRERVRCRVRFTVDRLDGETLEGQQELLLVRADSGDGADAEEGAGTSWKIAEATAGAPEVAPAENPPLSQGRDGSGPESGNENQPKGGG